MAQAFPAARFATILNDAVIPMAGQLAIVAYRCLVAGIRSGKLDFQVRWFAEEDATRVRSLIEAEPYHSYLNSEGETVCWELVHIFEIESFSPENSGEEVIGFIASTEEISDLA